jgi:hypothetical protein
MGLRKAIKHRLYQRYFQRELHAAIARRRWPDLEPSFWPLHDACKPFTLTSTERLYTLYKAVGYVVSRNVPGDFVECGVWRGGSVMMMALTLQHLGTTRRLWCFDTFEGMPAPTDADIRHTSGEKAAAILARTEKQKQSDHTWAVAGVEEVQRNVASTGYPSALVHLERGRVEETIPGAAPAQIALLRLDTDWYESTRHELQHLYPRVSAHGVLIVDDYGFWRGARKAVDEYFEGIKVAPFLTRIDDTGRIAIKPNPCGTTSHS